MMSDALPVATRVLIVEDEQLVAADLESKLHRLGLEVVGSAPSGWDAIRLAQETQPDLILMDIKLQGEMDGVETARKMRQTVPAKVIFMSAFGQLSRISEGITQLGTCLTKPYSYSQLRTAVADILASGT